MLLFADDHHHLFFQGNKLIAATESGVLANLDRALGVINWRTLLPTNGNVVGKLVFTWAVVSSLLKPGNMNM
jgi:hypothetical protein